MLRPAKGRRLRLFACPQGHSRAAGTVGERKRQRAVLETNCLGRRVRLIHPIGSLRSHRPIRVEVSGAECMLRRRRPKWRDYDEGCELRRRILYSLARPSLCSGEFSRKLLPSINVRDEVGLRHSISPEASDSTNRSDPSREERRHCETAEQDDGTRWRRSKCWFR